jgi:hypothetical protein
MIPLVKIKKLPNKIAKARMTEILKIASDPTYKDGAAGGMLKDALFELPGSDARKNLLVVFFNDYIPEKWIEADEEGWAEDQLFLLYAMNVERRLFEFAW